MTDRTTDKEPTQVPTRADRRRKQPSAIDLGDTESLDDMLGDEAKSRSPSQEHPLTRKLDAGDPPVRFGGRGGGYPLSLPLSMRQPHRPVNGCAATGDPVAALCLICFS